MFPIFTRNWKKMTEVERRNVVAHLFALNIGASPFIPFIVLALSENWTNWNILLLVSAGVLGPICYVKALPYCRWCADKSLELGKRFED